MGERDIYDGFENGWGETPPSYVPVKIRVGTNIVINGNLKEIRKDRKVWSFFSKIRRSGKYLGYSRTTNDREIDLFVAPERESLGKPEKTLGPLPLRLRTAR